ncbi:minor capsid protein [Lactobacillus sp. ESL0679]|uniref:minor capsid protein n=1 Tax=Lactobacillus sp. ESL0679 TaxID=2983209 RepID=UPI0023F6A05F|nr:minor capsid protein [Lactobacillus sp. ESL0679]MDF7683403.1 minor capsid protein [Lactobacillus sp. ESL0679]
MTTRKTRNYWKNRQLELKQRQLDNATDYEAALRSRMKMLFNEIQKEIDKFLARYAANNDIDVPSARKLLAHINTTNWQMTLKEFEEKAKAGGFDKELDNEYFKSRIARLQDINKQLQELGGKFADKESDRMGDALANQFQDTYLHQNYNWQDSHNGFSIDFTHFNETQLKQIANQPWQGSNFSKRIWKNYHDVLPNQLTDALLRGTLLGYSADRVTRMLKDRFADVTNNQIHRLVVTEMGHAAENATAEFYEDSKIEQYEYMATLESHTCEQCGYLDGKIFNVKDRIDGENYPLIHPYCRCTTVPYDNTLPDIETRWMRDPKTGKGKLVDSMSFQDWKKQYVDGVAPESKFDPMDKTQWPKHIRVSDSDMFGKQISFESPEGRTLGSESLDKMARWDDEDVKDTLGEYYKGDEKQQSSVFNWIKKYKDYLSKPVKPITEEQTSQKYTADLFKPKPLGIDIDKATNDELRNYISSNYGMQFEETSRTKLSNIALKETIKTIDQFKDLYSAFPDKIPVLHAYPKSKMGNTIAWYSSYVHDYTPVEFGLNTLFFKDSEYLKRTVEANVKSHWFSDNADANHIMLHEFCHHIDRQLSKLMGKGFSDELFTRIANEGNPIDVKAIGRYAESSLEKQHSHVEAFAEIMTEAYGPTPGKQALAFKQEFEKMALEVLNKSDQAKVIPTEQAQRNQIKKAKLTFDEKQGLNSYLSSWSYKINDKLRRGIKLDSFDKATMKKLDSALNNLPKYKSDKQLQRSIELFNEEDIIRFLKKWQPGKIVEEPSYTSASKGVYASDDNIQIIVKHHKNGRDLAGYGLEAEKEVLFKRGTKFKVLDGYLKDNKIFLEVDEID